MTTRGTTEQQREHVTGLDPFTAPAATHTLAEAPVRARVVVEATVGPVRTVAWAGGPVTEVTLVDDTDVITLAFFGDRRLGGVHAWSRLVAAGAVVAHHGRRIIMNPQLWLTPASVPDDLVAAAHVRVPAADVRVPAAHVLVPGLIATV